MGIEYQLTVPGADHARIERAMSRIHHVSAIGSPASRFEFRAESERPGMPDATAVLEPNGLYFCDHGGSGRTYLGQLVAVLVAEFGSVHVADLA